MCTLKMALFLNAVLLVPTMQMNTGNNICAGLNNSVINDNITFESQIVKNMIKNSHSIITKNQFNAFLHYEKSHLHLLTCDELHKKITSFSMKHTQGFEVKSGIVDVKPMVWVASIVSVIIISTVGLLGVAVVPFVSKSYYNKVIQFLVAVAVGCLTGDAFLHLLPHAIAGGHSHGEHLAAEATGIDSERETVLKGLVALIGIYFFFLVEKCVTSISEFRTEKKADEEERLRSQSSISFQKRPSSTLRESISLNSPSPMIGENHMTTGLANKALKTLNALKLYYKENELHDTTEQMRGSCSLQIPVISYSNYLDSDEEGKENINKNIEHISTSPTDKTVDVLEHGHSHKVPGSMASVAWMVIMGDGLHNFTDGMAIGVAFTASIGGGISTTVAVFCHELPHELGDFAVLLKTGMCIKQALMFNIVSSVLCLIGMFVGIGVGNLESASAWIFALTAGTFIYIALVDMLPQLNNVELKPGESRIVQFLIQNVGLIIGGGIMLIISVFEKQLHHIVG